MPKLPESAVRFSDAQMREEPELVAASVRYAMSYVGDWDVMLAARRLVAETGTLPLAVARTVANCARSDPRYVLAMLEVKGDSNVVPLRPCRHIPHHWNDCCQTGSEAAGETTDDPPAAEAPTWPFQWPPDDARHQCDLNSAGYCRNRACDYEPDPPKVRRARTRFKHRYYWSTHRGAYRTHILDPRESYTTWSPRGLQYRIYGWCHATVANWTTGNTPPAGRDVCPSCTRAEERAVAEIAAQVFDPQSNNVVN